MHPLRWTWSVTFAPYARASLASQPLNVAVAPLLGFALAFLMGRQLSIEARVGAGLGLTVLVLVLWLAQLSRQLRRRRRTVRGQTQTYVLSRETLVLSVGQDSYSLPTAELTVSTRGRDWLAVRRPALGRRPLLLFFDDPALVEVVDGVLREHGAATPR